ncbi:MAG: hypothetical protein JWQ04_2255, partial [Pedosphaera sp.]|nr:hypothetical protein [Pedosphaera sp.]
MNGVMELWGGMWEANRAVRDNQMTRAADAKEVGMGNPAEETYRPPG